MNRQPRQKKAEIQRLSSISNLRAKQLASSFLSSKNANAQQEAERIEHFDLELRPTKLQELKLGDAVSGGENMVTGFLDAVSKIGRIKCHCDDDSADKLSRRHTSIFLLLFTIIVSTKQYVGDPIACWTPAQFTGAHVEYANYICWVSNSYYLHWSERTMARTETRRNLIPYYQWVPFILPCIALIFYMPSAVWHSFLIRRGFQLSSLVRTFESTEDLEFPLRAEMMLMAAQNFDRALYAHYIGDIKLTSTGICKSGICYPLMMMMKKLTTCFGSLFDIFKCGKGETRSRRPSGLSSSGASLRKMRRVRSSYPNRLTYMYVLMKCVHITNVTVQIYLLKFVIGESYRTLGYDMFKSIINNEEWKINENFPRVTLCDFIVRNLADNNHQHTVQCVLPVNIFNEKIFIIIWFWYTIVLVCTLTTAVQWLCWFCPASRVQFIRNNLELCQKNLNITNWSDVDYFVRKYLRPDGVLLLRILSKNANQANTRDFIFALWKNYNLEMSNKSTLNHDNGFLV